MQYERAYKVLFNASINALAKLDQMTEKTPKIKSEQSGQKKGKAE